MFSSCFPFHDAFFTNLTTDQKLQNRQHRLFSSFMSTSHTGKFPAPISVQISQTMPRYSDGTIDPCLLALKSASATKRYDSLERTPVEYFSPVTSTLSVMDKFPTYPSPQSFMEINPYFETDTDTQEAPAFQVDQRMSPSGGQGCNTSWSQSLIERYDELFKMPPSKLETMDFWRSATQRAVRICAAISTLVKTGYYDISWLLKIETSIGWRNYSLSTINKPFDPNGFVAKVCPGDETKLDALLKALHDTAKALDVVRDRFILDFAIDPLQPSEESLIIELETSDSCDINEDDDYKYRQMRDSLQAFQHDPNRAFCKTVPIEDARLRKDIRAWARIARFRCIKLPCSSMLIQKHAYLLPQRRRRQRQQPREGLESLASEFPFLTWQRSRHHLGYQSGNSSGGCSSASNASASKKRKLPRDEGGYICYFQDCGKAFNRQCDLSHHQRKHRPKETLPYACEHCDKRFGFPKDLRRHEETHRSKDTSEDQ